MATTVGEVRGKLLSGTVVDWSPYEGHKGGSIKLDTPAKRRLFAFLFQQNSGLVAQGSESLFAGLIASWKDEKSDPASTATSSVGAVGHDSWRLIRIEASGIGGLTAFEGPLFDLQLNGENWCLEGQNGSGKTSLASAILWAITGRRIREHIGPEEDPGTRSAVTDDSGKEIGMWPSLAAYPSAIADLGKTAEVWVRLTFRNHAGDYAQAFRKSRIPVVGIPTIEAKVDTRLLTSPELVETGLLMPCRLAQMGFGERSQSLYDAVKMLTGLDQLADIGDGVSNHFAHGARKFLRYAKDQGIELKAKTFDDNMAEATKKGAEVGLDLSVVGKIHDKEIWIALRDLAKKLSSDAGKHLDTLKTEIASNVEIDKPEGRKKVRQAVDTARLLADQKPTPLPLFSAWAALTDAGGDEQFLALPNAIEEAESELKKALAWNLRQLKDKKLRLKALAAQWYLSSTVEVGKAGDCPLCDGPLVSEGQKKLAGEMEELKAEANAAERKIQDVCSALEKKLRSQLPKDLQTHWSELIDQQPGQQYVKAISNRFVDQSPFKDVLVGLAKLVQGAIGEQSKSFPKFVASVVDNPAEGEPQAASELRQLVRDLRYLTQLVNWWKENRSVFRLAWGALVGAVDESGSYPTNTIHGHLAAVDHALAKAEPYDEVARRLELAAQAAESWQAIQVEQKVREAIRDGLEPLKALRGLVEAETARSIGNLSGRIEKILKRIHLRERLSYENTALKKKAVYVHGSFAKGMKIDAGLVANSSWLKAILWAFVLALREETIEAKGVNAFPLFLLDDPQATFDPRNKRKWAEEMTRLANLDPKDKFGAQLVLTTHEREFFNLVTEVNKLVGQTGRIAATSSAMAPAIVVNGSSLERRWNEANSKNDDEVARQYVREMRIYIENLLKIMLHAEGAHIGSLNLDSLRRELVKLRETSVAPFNRRVFETLLHGIGGGTKPVLILNGPPHSDDGTIGLAEAADVRKYWLETLQPRLHAAFEVYAHFIAFQGDPRTFSFEPTIVSLPIGQAANVKTLALHRTGIAAAAKTDGRAGDGVLTLEEWEATKLEKIVLYNHDVCRLSASTLEPVAALGDLLIVSNYVSPGPRDLVTAAFGGQCLARRYNGSEAHPDIVILTGQANDPGGIAEPVIVPRKGLECRKIVGVVYNRKTQISGSHIDGHEVVALSGDQDYRPKLSNARLFQVKGRSAEPLALDGQFLITQAVESGPEIVKKYDGELVVAIDDTGAKYFKRLRLAGESLVVLESLNPDGTTSAEILSIASESKFPKLQQVLPVVGVLFELPQ